jgi:enoyl-CoA hydratase/carnithine racemase
MSVSDILLREDLDGIAVLTLNRPEKLNALSQDLAERLSRELHEIAAQSGVRVVIITGAGDRAFSVGMDLKERRNLTPAEKWRQSEPLRRLCDQIWHMPQPVVAAIRGWCLGGGFEIAINCDMRVAEESATFAWPEMQLGAFPGGSAAVIFPRLVGRAFAKKMFFTARRVKAGEALERGIVDEIAKGATALDHALSLAAEIKTNSSPLGCAAVKRMVNGGGDMSVAEALLLNEALRAPLDATQDYEEGIEAFFERRAPVWRGK